MSESIDGWELGAPASLLVILPMAPLALRVAIPSYIAVSILTYVHRRGSPIILLTSPSGTSRTFSTKRSACRTTNTELDRPHLEQHHHRTHSEGECVRYLEEWRNAG